MRKLTTLILLLGAISSWAATEDQPPDSAIISQTTYSETNTASIDEDPDSPDANWALIGGNHVNGNMRVSFPTPSPNPTVGADLQEFRVQLRQQSAGQTGTPTARLEVWETGGIAALAASSEINITAEDPGQVISFTWNANLLATANGSAVECFIFVTRSGGAPGARESCDIGAVEWVVDYTTPSSRRRISVSP